MQRFGKEGSYRGMRLGYGYGRKEKAKGLYCGLGSGYGGGGESYFGLAMKIQGFEMVVR